ncbi:MAG: hypothetical protein AAFU79_14400, partial [Myxococcota bacterium]
MAKRYFLGGGLMIGLLGACSGDDEATDGPEDAGPTCLAATEAFPISSALQTGPGVGFYETVNPFEYADFERTHVHRADFFGSFTDPLATAVSVRSFDGVYPTPYNVATRERDELFVYGGDPTGGVTPYVAKLDLSTGAEAWRTEIPQPSGAFSWPGLALVHGNGDVYALHGTRLVRLDAASGALEGDADLPAPTDIASSDTVYNGFTVGRDGLIVAKSISRPAGCEAQGPAALGECAGPTTPVPPSMVITVDPDTLEVLGRLEMPELVGGRLAQSRFEGEDYIYVGGNDDIYRVRRQGSALALDPWRYSGFLQESQAAPSAVVVMGDWVVFQMNASPGQTPMTVHAVAQRDPQIFARRDPFGPGGFGISFVPSSLTADSDTLRIYSQDTGRGQIAGLELVEGTTGPELVELWVVDQVTLHHLSLVGPSDARVLVSTDAPAALMALGSGATDYEERVVWRSAATGMELA